MMRQTRWLVVAGVLVLISGAWILSSLVSRDDDPCLSAGRQPIQVHRRNPYIYTCEDAVYLPTADVRVNFRRVDGLRATQIGVLPFKYLRATGELYFVALVSAGWEETEYELRVIDGIDLPTMEILAEGLIQDMNDHVNVQPRQ
jgi:hypothetical protein